jgi:hypothetical protein
MIPEQSLVGTMPRGYNYERLRQSSHQGERKHYGADARQAAVIMISLIES